jgi:O-antigen ligase
VNGHAAAARRLATRPGPWAGAAVVIGMTVGVFAARDASMASKLVVAGVGAIVAVLVLRSLEFGVVALLFTLPLDRFGRIPGLPVHVTAYQLLLVVVLVSWGLVIAARGREMLRFSWLDVGMAAVMGAALWSLPHSHAPGATVTAMARLVFLWLFTLLYANAASDERRMRAIVTALLVTVAGAGLLAVGQQWFGLDLGAIKDYRDYGGGVNFSRAGAFFKDPNQLGTFMSVGFLMALALLVRATGRTRALLLSAVVAISGLALIASLSRTAWVGTAIGVVLVIALAPARRRVPIAWAAVALGTVAVLLASPLIIQRALSVSDVSGDRSVATRFYMTESTLAMIRDNPVWGTGLDAFPQVYPAYRLPGSSATIVELHQLPLALPVEMGLAGLLAEIVFLGCLVAVYWRKRPSGFTGWEAATLSALVALLVQTFFQYYLYFEYMWLVLALGVAATRLARAQEEDS